MRILYVEDTPIDVALVRSTLVGTAPDFALEVAATLAQAKARLADSAPLDVVLCGLNLPDGSGLELLAHIRAQGLPVAVVILTGTGDEAAVVAALKAGADAYLIKNREPMDRLPEILSKALAHFRSARNWRGRPLKALYAEDDARDIDLTRRHLAQHAPHIRLEVVEDARAVLARLPENAEATAAYDVLVLDYQLPGGDALELVKVLRDERGLTLPIVLVTGQGSEAIAARAMHLGVDDYLIKHAGYLHALPGTLESVCHKAMLMHERAALMESEARIRLILDSTAEAIYGNDMQGHCTFVNPAFLRLLGYERAEDLLGHPIHSLIHHTHADGTPYPGEDCQIYRAYRQNEAIHRDDEVFWHRDGHPIPVEYWSYPMHRDGQVVGAVATFFDISERKRNQAQLDHLAHYDPLTDLPNRTLLHLRLDHALERAKRHDQQVAILHLDLDHFKSVNDSLGHETGDNLLLAVVTRLNSRIRAEDTLARPGGDEFLLLLEPVLEAQEAAEVARDLLALLALPFTYQGEREIFLGASIGISVYPDDGGGASELLRGAETAMYRAKAQGRNRFCFYTGDMNVDALAKLELETALRHALERDELVLHYQPKVDLQNGHIAGAEALLRWRRNASGLTPPADFIPLAEKSGLIVPIGAWVIDTACRQIRTWCDAGLAGVRVAVNVSARQFHSADLEATVAGALERHQVPPQQLELELTESILMEDPEATAHLLDRLKRIGVKLSLDDFGTGYSSFTYLSRFPIDALKIDQSFVRGIVTDPDAAGIVSAVIGLARRLRLKVVAEGVETEAQLGYLRKQGCEMMQGYYFSKPVPAREFAEMLRVEKSLPAAEAAASGSRTLLLVDDEANILSALRRMLRNEGYRILTAASAREGLELLATNNVQVILSDQRMPEMNGTEFLGRVRELHPDTVRIVLSGYSELDTIIQAVNQGAIYKFLIKPWDDDQLREHIRDAFRYYEAILQPRALLPAGV